MDLQTVKNEGIAKKAALIIRILGAPADVIQMNSLFLGMFDSFQKHLADKFAFLKGKKLLIATSGGIDSMVMTELLHKAGYEITLAHCNFNLRASESDEDQKYIETYALQKEIPLFIESFNTAAFAKDNKLSIQLAARELRYSWFHELAGQHAFDYILTAHHADDNLETFLINLSRGTGLEGLTGIPQQNGKIIRPLLAFSRSDIENYAKENNIKWREDSSNASDKYLRNKIRHDIVPVLKELNASFMDSFKETSNHLQQSKSMVDDASVLVYKQVVIEKEDKIIFRISDLKRLPNYQAYLYQWLRDFGFTAWDDIYGLVDAQSGKQVLSAGFRLLKDREILILTPLDNVHQPEIHLIEKDLKQMESPLNLSFCKAADIYKATDNCIFVDEDKLTFPLQLRKWEEGDFFYPLGMNGKKKVGKFFKDEKMSLIDKADAWILCSANEIVWIINRRADDRFKVTNTTKNILQIKTT